MGVWCWGGGSFKPSVKVFCHPNNFFLKLDFQKQNQAAQCS